MTSTIEPSGYLKKVLSHDETVLVLSRQHWLVLFKHIFLPLLAAIVMGAVIVWAELKLNVSAHWAIVYLVILIPLIHIFWKLLVWENHIYVVTNRRVAQLSGVFSKEVVDSLLEKVNDVKTDQSFMGRIFGYGDLEILTASEAGKNDFRHIEDPLGFKRSMLDAKEALGHSETLA